MNREDLPIHQTYVERANALDSAGTDSSAARFRLTPQFAEKLFTAMAFVQVATEGTDELKKHLFYGKPYLDNGMGINPTQMPEVMRTTALSRLNNHDTIRILHAAMGLVTEAGEMFERLMKYVLGGLETLDLENLEEESGDLLWYLALCAKALGHPTFDNFMMGNIAKLEKRYRGTTWNQEGALNRDTKAEMLAMAEKTSEPGKGPLHPAVVSQMDPEVVNAIENMEREEDPIPQKSKANIATGTLTDTQLIRKFEEFMQITCGTNDANMLKNSPIWHEIKDRLCLC